MSGQNKREENSTPTAFALRFLEKIEVPDGLTEGITYVGATPTPGGDVYDYDQD